MMKKKKGRQMVDGLWRVIRRKETKINKSIGNDRRGHSNGGKGGRLIRKLSEEGVFSCNHV